MTDRTEDEIDTKLNYVATIPFTMGPRSVKISDLEDFRCKLNANEPSPQYGDIINFERSAMTQGCVMCGALNVAIPIQNKSVCKACDGAFWFQKHLNIVVKFCKGGLVYCLFNFFYLFQCSSTLCFNFE
jgi:hypothetical protein